MDETPKRRYIMKLYFASTLLSIAVIIGGIFPTFAQSNKEEIDDLYFNASDRKTIAYEKINEPAKASYDSKGSYKYEDESLSAKNVNPEYIAKYQAPEDTKVRKNDSYTSEEYYVEEEDRAEYQDRDVKVYNNYYGSSFRPYPHTAFGNPFYDPFYDPFFYDPFYAPFRPFSSRFTMSFGFGFGTGWGYNSFWGRPYYGAFHDPFYGGGFYRPYSAAYYNGFYNGFYTGLHHNYYRPGVIVVNPGESVNGRGIRYTTGRQGYSRGSRLNTGSTTVTDSRGVARESRAVSNQSVAPDTKNSRNGRVSTEGRTFDNNRDFSATQNEYYNRSRSRVNTDNTSRNRNTYSSPAIRNDRSVNRDNTNRSSRTYSRPSAPSNNRSNTYSAPSRTREYSSPSRSRSSSPSYSSPSRSSSPSYSSPSRSSSPSYSSPSRSSSPSSSSPSNRSRRP